MTHSGYLHFPWKLVWYTFKYAITGQPSLVGNVNTQPATALTTSIIRTGQNTTQFSMTCIQTAKPHLNLESRECCHGISTYSTHQHSCEVFYALSIFFCVVTFTGERHVKSQKITHCGMCFRFSRDKERNSPINMLSGVVFGLWAISIILCAQASLRCAAGDNNVGISSSVRCWLTH